ncbi:MAG: GNAT family N-acetyltransferase [Pseudomonadota bacterium]
MRGAAPAQIRLLSTQHVGLLATAPAGLFDGPVTAASAEKYLSDPRNLMAGAVSGDMLVGFASALDHHHPDKPGELWINEISVLEAHRRQGIGRALIACLRAHARLQGLATVWVLAEARDPAACAFYRAIGATADETVMFTYAPP